MQRQTLFIVRKRVKGSYSANACAAGSRQMPDISKDCTLFDRDTNDGQEDDGMLYSVFSSYQLDRVHPTPAWRPYEPRRYPHREMLSAPNGSVRRDERPKDAQTRSSTNYRPV